MTQRVNFIIGIFLLYWMIKGLNLVYLILMDKINSKNTNKNNNNNSKKSIGYSEENKIIQYYKRKSKINKVTNFYPNVISSIGFSILKIFNIEENYNKYIFFVNDKYLKYIYEDYLIYKKENNLNYFYVSLRLFTNNENRIYALIVYFDMFEKYIDEQVNYLINNKYEYNSRNKHKNKDIDILHLKGYYTKVVINRFWTGSGIRKEDFMENLGEDYRNKCYVYEVDNIDVSRTGIVFYMDTVYFNIFLIGGNIGYLLKENYIFLEKCEHLAMEFNSRGRENILVVTSLGHNDFNHSIQDISHYDYTAPSVAGLRMKNFLDSIYKK